MLFLSANSANSNRKKNPKCFRTSDQLAFFALYFSFAFISFAGFTADLASADDHPVDEEFTPPPPPILVSGKIQYNAQKAFPRSIVIGSSDAS